MADGGDGFVGRCEVVEPRRRGNPLPFKVLKNRPKAKPFLRFNRLFITCRSYYFCAFTIFAVWDGERQKVKEPQAEKIIHLL